MSEEIYIQSKSYWSVRIVWQHHVGPLEIGLVFKRAKTWLVKGYSK